MGICSPWYLPRRGMGKTTTIRMWVEEAGYPVAWVTLEKSDNDLKQFLTYFLTALDRQRMISVTRRWK